MDKNRDVLENIRNHLTCINVLLLFLFFTFLSHPPTSLFSFAKSYLEILARFSPVIRNMKRPLYREYRRSN